MGMNTSLCRQERLPRQEAAEEQIGVAVEQFGNDLVLAASFQDCVLIDIVTRVDPDIEVLFIDTGFHFSETIAYVEEIRALFDLRLRVVGPVGGGGPACGEGGCCQRRKVAPLDRALESKRAWMSGLRRDDSSDRADITTWSWDHKRGLVKINPLADWSDTDISEYVDHYRLPRHPLTGAGYLSIGCAPTTRPVAPGGHPRSGRWPGTDKTECGIHL